MNEKDMMKIKESLTMPSEMADALQKTVTAHGRHHEDCRRFSTRARSTRSQISYSGKRVCFGRYRGVYAAAAALFCILAVGSTSFAYNVYQEKQLAVFMDADLSQEDIDHIGQEIAGICEISDCQSISLRYVDGDEAWEEFKAAYFTDENDEEMTELTGAFKENPLADSFNYRVSVRMNADTQAVRSRISRLPGVRKVTTVREAELADSAGN